MARPKGRKKARRKAGAEGKAKAKKPAPGLSQNVPKTSPFRWTGPKRRAAELLAADELTDEQAAAAVGIDRRTLTRWKARPEFAAAVAESASVLGAVARRHAIGRRASRVGWLEDRAARMRRVIDERAAAPGMEDVPGGRTGLLCRTVRGLGSGDNFREVEEYEVDTGLLKEMRDHERQAAQELGQWAEKHKHEGNGPNGEIPLKVTHDASGLEPYRAVFALFAKSVLDGVRDGTVQPDRVGQPVDTPDAVAQAGPVPRP